MFTCIRIGTGAATVTSGASGGSAIQTVLSIGTSSTIIRFARHRGERATALALNTAAAAATGVAGVAGHINRLSRRSRDGVLGRFVRV